MEPTARKRRVTAGARRAPRLPRRAASVAARLETTLIQAVVALGVLVVLSQFLLTVPATRYVMSYVSRLEGVALDSGGASVTIALRVGTPGQAAYLAVNGQRAASFALGSVRIRVKGGDLLEVDGTRLNGDGVFVVLLNSGGVAAPAVGSSVTTHGGIASLGRVAFETGPGGP